MRKLLLVLLLCAASSEVFAQASFEYYWPWIRSHISSNDVFSSNSITLLIRDSSSSTGMVRKVTNNTWAISFPSNTPTAVVDTSPSSGFWGKGSDLHLRMLPIPFEVAAGFWQMRADGHIIVGTNFWTDTYWKTNNVGHVVMRSVP